MTDAPEATFHVVTSFQLPSRLLFVMAGDIVSGVIKPGMIAQLPRNSMFQLTLLIHAIEFARHANGEWVCLCAQCESREDLDSFLRLDIGGEILRITRGEGQAEKA